MCKFKLNLSKTGLAAGLSVLIGLAAQSSQAQIQCSKAIGDGPIGPVESTAHLGDTIHFGVDLFASATVCQLQGGTNWVILPDGTVHLIVANYNHACNTTFEVVCPGGPGCIGDVPTSGGFFTYGPITLADVGRQLAFTTPRGTIYTSSPSSPAARAGQIFVGAITDARSIDCASGNIDVASGQGIAHVTIVNPCISVNKQCDFDPTKCGGTAFAYGAAIRFKGTVSNCGDIRLVNVSVTDTPAGPTSSQSAITYDAVAPSGRAFDGSLNIGESVVYHGSYQPSGNLCGPFTDTVTATGTDTASIPKTVTATASATCPVCTNPGIDVEKECIDTFVQVGQDIRYRVRVRNTGDVPLNVVLVDDSGTPGNTADDLNCNNTPAFCIGNLPANNVFTGWITNVIHTTANFCTLGITSVTNTVVATGANVCNPAQTVTDTAKCTANILCTPKICVIKEIACLIDTNQCGVFGKDATGFKVVTPTSTNLPAFCYRITIINCGPVGLTNVTVIDDKYGDLTVDFLPCIAGVLDVGEQCTFTFKVELPFDVTNTVTAAGRSVATGQTTTVRDSATGHVFQASIACDKLVTSPDDIDGNPTDSHVLFPCGSGLHKVSYFVVVTNTGDADLTNIVISDPLLANYCTLPAPFSLPAGGFTLLPLCQNLDFECGTGGGSNNCTNPMLKQATGCTVLQLGGGKVDITGPAGGIQGNVCIGPNGKLSITGDEYVTGAIELGAGATFSKSGAGTVGPVIHTNLSAEINAAIAASTDAAALPCTMTISSLNQAQTITGNGGLNVICVQKVELSGGKVVYLNGTASDRFVINVTGKFALSGGSQIRVAGGVLPKNVLYNIIGTGEQVAFSGGGGGTTCCKAVVDGTLIALQRNIALSPGLVNGQLIGGRDISIVSGSSVRCPPGCNPISVPNTVTVEAEVSPSQSNTNFIPACVFEINGRPIRTSSQCSALVECR